MNRGVHAAIQDEKKRLRPLLHTAGVVLFLDGLALDEVRQRTWCRGYCVRSCTDNHGVHHLEKTEQAAADRMMRIWQHHHEPDSSGERSSADTAGVGVSGKGIAVVLAVAAAVRANAA